MLLHRPLVLSVLCTLIFVGISIGQQQLQKKTAEVEGDVVIGALFSVHQQPKQTRTCGEIREQYGIQRVEVTFHTLDEINSNSTILPNIRLGVEIRDSCWYSPIALEQSLEFIRDTISPDVVETSNATVSTPDICLKQQQQQKRSKKRKILIGVVGPGSSVATIQVQNLLQLFSIPQIGYSATSTDLSDKNRFSTFLRVVPPDKFQAQAMVDIVKHHDWNYVSVVSTEGSYGQGGSQAFQEIAAKNNICIAKIATVLSNAPEGEFDKVIETLQEDKSANVVICFCEGKTVMGLMEAVRRNDIAGKYFFIGSDGWADRKEDVVEGYEREALGALTIRISSQSVSSFDDYYFNLKPHSNKRNPWFRDFWEQRFNCSFENKENKRRCTEDEKLSDKYMPDPKMGFIKTAFYTMAHGLHNMQLAICKNASLGLCDAMLPFNGSLFLEYLKNVTFTYENATVEFDEDGDPPGRYDIMNFQHENGRYDYVKVGTWVNRSLNLFGELQYNSGNGMVQSRCSQPCGIGQYKNFQSGGQEKKCCWSCVTCANDSFISNDTTCTKCQYGKRANASRTGCEDIPVEHMDWTDTQAIVAVAIAALGFMSTVATLIVFVLYNNTPVVKSSTRELSYLILIGMCMCYATTFPLIAEPRAITCLVARVMPGLSFCMIYASLLTKTNRIARILAGSKKKIITKKPRFMSATSLVVITFLLIGVELAIILYMLLREPADVQINFRGTERGLRSCNTSGMGIMAPMGFDLFLIAMCTVYAVKTRNVPENFNEAKFIGFAMYTTCVIWVAFVPIYFGSDFQVITMCLCVSLSAIVTLICLFFPKLYIILFRPERNNRSYFTTTKSVRCFIGNASNHAVISRNSTSYSISDYSTESPRTQSVRSFQSDWPGRRGRVIASTPLASPLSPEDEEDKKKRLGSILKRAYGSQIDIPSITEEKEEEVMKRLPAHLHHNVVATSTSFCQTGYELLAAFVPTLKNILNNTAAPETASGPESWSTTSTDKRQLLNQTDQSTQFSSVAVAGSSAEPANSHCRERRSSLPIRSCLVDNMRQLSQDERSSQGSVGGWDSTPVLSSRCQSLRKGGSVGCDDYYASPPDLLLNKDHFHILEETASDCSDTGSYEVKKITIRFGSPSRDESTTGNTTTSDAETTVRESFTPPVSSSTSES